MIFHIFITVQYLFLMFIKFNDGEKKEKKTIFCVILK
jgi:hypothetical protein